MFPSLLSRRFGHWSLAKRFCADKRGVSAVEFALILPIMCTLVFATVETTSGLRADRKLTIVTRTISDLSAQTGQITNPDMTGILDAGAVIMSPFPTASLAMTVTGIQINDRGQATVAWSDSRGGTRRGCGSAVSIPASLLPPAGQRGFVVMAESTYQYRPVIPWLMPSAINMSERLFNRPRVGDSVARMTSATTTQCPLT